MRVTVLFGGQLAEAAGVHREELELPEGSSLADLLGELGRIHGPRLTSAMAGRVLVLVNGRSAEPSRAGEVRLSDGDFVSILPPVSGGLT